MTSLARATLLRAAEVFAEHGRARVAGLFLEGDVSGLGAALREGRLPQLVNAHGWPVPEPLEELRYSDAPERLGLTDELLPVTRGIALLRPRSLVVGIDETGHRALPTMEMQRLVCELLARFGLSIASVAGVVRTRGAEVMRSPAGTPLPPCESAALYSAGASAHTVVATRDYGQVKLAIARRTSLGPFRALTPTYRWTDLIDSHTDVRTVDLRRPVDTNQERDTFTSTI